MLVAVSTVTNPEPDLVSPWRIAPGAELRLRFWGEECVVFHGAAGNTHLLPEIVGSMLQALLNEDASAERLSVLVDLHVADVRSALLEMSALGLTESAA